MSYVVIAEFRARPDRVADYAALLDRHARASRAEAGCLTFDVNQDIDDEAVFVLYEVYRDADGYAAHRETAHYRRFRETAPSLVEAQDGNLFVARRVLRRR